MTDTHDPRSVIQQAEQAASAGDYFAAAAFLRDAASQQEASLGPFHPDLANTLNNLGVVYETIDQPADAERCYRRAYSIAVTSLAPDHPFVSTSEKNFRDFCGARGIPFEPPTPLPGMEPAPAAAERRAEVKAEARTEAKIEAKIEARTEMPMAVQATAAKIADEVPVERVDMRTQAVAPAADASPPRSRALGMVAVAGFVALVAAGVWLGRSGGTESSSAESPQSSSPSLTPEIPAPAPAREAAVVPPPAPAAPDADVKPAPKPVSEAKPAESPRARSAVASASANATVENAGLCTELSTRDWRCTSASPPIDAGQLFFYTRVKSPANLTVEHRWYWGDRLHRRVSLYVQSNQRGGFRTYSRTAVKPGNWRVELRTRDGAVLHQEAFTVR